MTGLIEMILEQDELAPAWTSNWDLGTFDLGNKTKTEIGVETQAGFETKPEAEVNTNATR